MTMKFLLCLCVALSSAAAWAKDNGGLLEGLDQDFPARLALPAGFSKTVDEVDAKCFAAPDYLVVIRIAAVYGKLYDWRLKALGTMSAFQLTLNSRDATIAGLKGIIKTYERDREWLTLRLKQSGETIAGQTSGLHIEKGVMWGVIVLQAALLVYQGVAD